MQKGGIQKYISLMRYVNPPRSQQKIDPLIATFGSGERSSKYWDGARGRDCKLKYLNFHHQRVH